MDPTGHTSGRRPLRIAMLVNDFPKVSQTFVLSQIVDLLKRGHEIDIFSRNANPEKILHQDLLAYGLFRHWRIVPVRQGKYNTMKKKWGPWLASHLIKHLSRSHTFSYLWKFQRRYRDALACLKPWRKKYDIIHAHFGPAGHWGLFLKDIKLLEGPLTVSIRGYDVPQDHTADFDRILWEKALIIQPSSRSLADSLAAYGCPREKCRIIYSGIDLERFPARVSTPALGKEIGILSVGRLVEKKGLSHALEAFARLLEHYPHASYTIIGEGPLREELQKKCQTLGIVPNVFFHGAGTQPQILQFLQKAHVFWAASVTSSRGDVEGDVNTIKEALAVGVPTVATRHGGITEMIDHEIHGLLVPERDAEALASATRTLLEHPERWASMARQGREKIERLFEHNRLSNELETIYYQMAGETEPSPGQPYP